MNNTSVDSYLEEGCGRCERFRTPECKVHRWTDALVALRALLLESDLVEEMKWGSPCYTLNGKNVIMLASLNDYCALSFFKGAALTDDEGLLEKPGPNTRFARYLKFETIEQVEARRAAAARFIEEAIAVEREGRVVDPGDASEPMPIELEQRLETDPDLRQAFEALTPGRRRSHILHISGAKKSETRARRVEKCAPKILAGRGFNER